MDDNKEICTISIPNGMFDNDYTFYENGKVKHYFDRNNFNFDNTHWINAKEIKQSDKIRILEKCNDTLKDKLKDLMGL